VGKTNKKLFLFDEQYKIVYNETIQLAETKDEDGFPCEDVHALTAWLKNAFARAAANKNFQIKAVNFSAYGASFVYLDIEGNVIAPLYNYLKPYSPSLQKKFYDDYGGESVVAKQTASPVLGNLNSGMQLYRLKYEKPELFSKIKYALHLPQYLSYVLSGALNTDLTSVGCHTNLWDFQKKDYHRWVREEGLVEKFAPMKDCSEIVGNVNGDIAVGTGLHDSSAALIPYLYSISEPFILLSTGTWCISLNPFNHAMLSDYELHHDCLCYLSYSGQPVKASRLFAGHEHEQQTKRLAQHFQKPLDHYKTVSFDMKLIPTNPRNPSPKKISAESVFEFSNYEEAYHQLIADLIAQQQQSTNLVLKETGVKKIYVDGGFSENSIYMCLLSNAYPELEVFKASVAQASAIGAALAIHDKWNHQSKWQLAIGNRQ
jgi:sugar (pentulose or hexulose) kinase